ncbi:MAG: hypothetical protein ACPGJU_02255 [Coraliomargarita sp.]
MDNTSELGRDLHRCNQCSKNLKLVKPYLIETDGDKVFCSKACKDQYAYELKLTKRIGQFR